AKVTGHRVVVLITDGEETCGGDPATAVEALAKSGVETRVDIVGFAIDEADLKNTFRYWASLGGGRFHDAADAGTLGASLIEALRTPFHVLDASGSIVADGLVGGEPVPLPAGEYRIRLQAHPPVEHPATVSSGKETRVTLVP
ncbi:MAG: hypothetical protein KC729_19330, partial [Candidatus Eisenbacteria bacterium]|nr:hypothetical protein [Candidatus Eisenbacteria bacterium]